MPTITQRARNRVDDDRQPRYVVRAPDSTKRGRWVTVGFAWELRTGDGYAIKLNTVPVGAWDGALVLLPPLQIGDGIGSEDVPEDRVNT